MTGGVKIYFIGVELLGGVMLIILRFTSLSFDNNDCEFLVG